MYQMLKSTGLFAFKPILLYRGFSASRNSVKLRDKYLQMVLSKYVNWDILRTSFQSITNVKGIRVVKEDDLRRAYVRFDHSVDLNQVLADYSHLAQRYKIKPAIYEPPSFELPSDQLLQSNHLLISNLPQRFQWGELKDYISFVSNVVEFRRKDADVIASFSTVEDASLVKYLLEGSVFAAHAIDISEYSLTLPIVSSANDGHFFHEDKQVYFTNLPSDITLDEIRAALVSSGISDIKHADLVTDQSGAFQHSCRVEFKSDASVHQAIELFHNSTKIKKHRVFVRTVCSVEERAHEREQRTVFLSNLPNKYFEQQEQVKALFVTLKDAEVLHLSVMYELFKHSRCVAYVEFDSPDAAQRAVQSLVNTSLEGRKVNAQIMHELLRSVYLKAVREFRFNDEMHMRTFDPKCVIEVKVPLEMKEVTVRQMFRNWGAVRNLLIKLDLFGNSTGWCVLEYEEEASVDKAINRMNEKVIDGHTYLVHRPKKPEQRVDEQESRQVVATQLPPVTTLEGLRSHFARMGEVLTCRLVGSVGFCEYATFEAAQHARERLHNSDFMGFTIVVTAPRTKLEKGQITNNLDGSEGNTVRHLKVQNVKPEVTYDELAEHFSKAGKVKFATVHRAMDGTSHGTATVEYYLAADAQKAFEMFKGSVWNDQQIHVRLKNARERTERAKAHRNKNQA